MRFSFTSALVIALAAETALGSTWFTKAAYNKWHETELERWLSDHDITFPKAADRKELQDLVKTNWQSAVSSPYAHWDTARLQKYLSDKGEEVKQGAEANKDSLLSQVKASWYESEEQASNAYTSVKDWVFDSWSESQIKAFLDKHGIPSPQPHKRDTLLKTARENYQSIAEKTGETLAYPGNWLWESWSNSDLKAFLDARGIPVPQNGGRDKMIASVRRNARLSGFQAEAAVSSASASLASASVSAASGVSVASNSVSSGASVVSGSAASAASVASGSAASAASVASVSAASGASVASGSARSAASVASGSARSAASVVSGSAASGASVVSGSAVSAASAASGKLGSAASVASASAASLASAASIKAASGASALSKSAKSGVAAAVASAKSGASALSGAAVSGASAASASVSSASPLSSVSSVASGASASASSVASNAHDYLSSKLLNTWSDSELKGWFDKEGIRVPQGSTRNEMIALARKYSAKLSGDNLSAKATSGFHAATSSAGNEYARATDKAGIFGNYYLDQIYYRASSLTDELKIAVGVKTNYLSSASRSVASASKSASSVVSKVTAGVKGEL